ncbi:MAG: substrate-binding domain-containing protein [Pseudomonadota bacterium]
MRAPLLATLLWGCQAPPPAAPVSSLSGDLSLSGAWALYPLAVRWADAFSALHPGVHVHVSAGGSGKGAVDVLDGFVDLGMLSRAPSAEEQAHGAWAVPVARDAVVLIASDGNPALEELRRRGISHREAAALYGGGIAEPAWAMLAPTTGAGRLRPYTRADACGTDKVFAAWLALDPDSLAGVGVFGDPGLVDVVRRDPWGLGYTNASMAYDPGSGRPVSGVAVLPVDLDDDDAIATGEAACADLVTLDAAAATGRYPAGLVRDLWLVARGEPRDPLLRAFLGWVLGDGQAVVAEAGHIALAPEALAGARGRVGL